MAQDVGFGAEVVRCGITDYRTLDDESLLASFVDAELAHTLPPEDNQALLSLLFDCARAQIDPPERR